MSNLLNQYHPFRESICRGAEPPQPTQAVVITVQAPAQQPTHYTQGDFEADSKALSKRIKLFTRLGVIASLLFGGIYLYGIVEEVFTSELAAAKEEAKAESEDDGDWEYQGPSNKAAPRDTQKISMFQKLFCRGNSRSQLCE